MATFYMDYEVCNAAGDLVERELEVEYEYDSGDPSVGARPVLEIVGITGMQPGDEYSDRNMVAEALDKAVLSMARDRMHRQMDQAETRYYDAQF